MIDPQLRAVVERLARAGTPFECVCIDLRTKKPLPPGAPLFDLEPAGWDAVWIPNWTLLPDGHPDAEFVHEQMTRFYADPAYEHALSETAAEIDCTNQEAQTEYDERDWDIPDGRLG